MRISRSGTARARRSPGTTPSPGPAGGAIVPSLRDLERHGQQPVAPLGRPRRRVVRHLEERARRERERGVEVRHQPVAVRPRVRAPPAAVLARDAAMRRHPRCPPTSTTSVCTTSTPPRRTRSRASARRPHQLAGCEPEVDAGGAARRTRRGRPWGVAPPASRHRAARAPARTRARSSTPSAESGRRACASPDSRRP